MHDSASASLQSSVWFYDARGGSFVMRGAGEEPSGSVLERHQCAESARGALLQGTRTQPPCRRLYLWSLSINGSKTLRVDKKIRSDIVGKALA